MGAFSKNGCSTFLWGIPVDEVMENEIKQKMLESQNRLEGKIEFIGLYKDTGNRAMPIRIGVNPSRLLPQVE